MTREEVYEHLCTYDIRNPYYNSFVEGEDIIEPRQVGCGCDNCYHNCDKLAVELLKYKDIGED